MGCAPCRPRKWWSSTKCPLLHAVCTRAQLAATCSALVLRMAEGGGREKLAPLLDGRQELVWLNASGCQAGCVPLPLAGLRAGSIKSGSRARVMAAYTALVAVQWGTRQGQGARGGHWRLLGQVRPHSRGPRPASHAGLGPLTRRSGYQAVAVSRAISCNGLYTFTIACVIASLVSATRWLTFLKGGLPMPLLSMVLVMLAVANGVPQGDASRDVSTGTSMASTSTVRRLPSSRHASCDMCIP